MFFPKVAVVFRVSPDTNAGEETLVAEYDKPDLSLLSFTFSSKVGYSLNLVQDEEFARAGFNKDVSRLESTDDNPFEEPLFKESADSAVGFSKFSLVDAELTNRFVFKNLSKLAASRIVEAYVLPNAETEARLCWRLAPKEDVVRKSFSVENILFS